MTGTPIHNTSKDIKSLLKLLDVTIDGNILRRTKTDVGIPMPSLEKTQICVQWEHHEEREMAKDIHSSLSMLHFEDRGSWSKMHSGKGAVLVSMLRGRQTCNLPRLLEKAIHEDKQKCENDDVPFSMYEYAIQNGHSKMSAISKHIIERKANGNGKIVFCHFTKEIETLTKTLQENGVEWVGGWREYTKLDSCNTPILILQIQTGCEGLNLQRFSEVYFICPHWNPAIEDQAIARCHRIGQQKKVEVFEFVMDAFMDIMDVTCTDHFSLDKYVLYKQNQKREKTDIFFDSI